MNTKENMIQDYDAVLDALYGKEGTPERAQFEEKAYAFYTGSILRDARKKAKISQVELAERTQTTKSYISRIENGGIIPSVAVFYKMIAALGMEIKITKPTYYSQYDICNTPYVCESDECTYGKK
ncbi:MAG: helix-turn-helix transcriptional regulator [Paludibacteraceae bacterium]|jgi:ribosome-binding protein aMBF1 (putative translation factor)|nr:helix-turn-helix transcriptional regulator [Paludibacteraceae bacterium]